ncbi:hypothetical protein NLN94_21680 [Citrobacter portucalensis]|uniref:hypothetical protein n=1 Tax=Citrobacter TaxID=544 RepID=UPI000B19D479|nr:MULTISPECIES: hypothetical protein [Citrobacter]MBW7618567.1 hypothetical protein [Citrobacter portucalensis]MBW7637003.1 hypothetical protein [Citrobacter portucalensis]MCA2131777.1 hypothetical protein [Citrobacter portucalensis]MCA2141869.1 hypothetical protein [Citrobacter portucalensis]MCA2147310.1 hypothetical protein [Citrobacter portucalensis]
MSQFIINVSSLDMLKLVTLFRGQQRRATEIAMTYRYRDNTCFFLKIKAAFPGKMR